MKQFGITYKIEGETLEQIVSALREFADDIESGEIEMGTIGGFASKDGSHGSYAAYAWGHEWVRERKAWRK